MTANWQFRRRYWPSDFGRQQRFLTFAESCLWKCEAVRANGGLRVSLRTHTIGQKRSLTIGAETELGGVVWLDLWRLVRQRDTDSWANRGGCTRDELADNIGRDIATVAKSVPLTSGALVIDPFTGSGNSLYWMLRHLPGAHGLGFEQDPIVFELASRNLATLNLSIEVSWSAQRMYGLNEPGQNHGLLLGAHGWAPRVDSR
jgi:hypothetical protein